MRQAEGEEPQGHALFRKIVLRVLFWALGLAACFGAAGVIFAGHDTLWRIVGTCAATAGGALLVFAASHLLDARTTWAQGTAVITVTVVEYLATLGLIWKAFGSAADPVGMTMTFLAATAIPAVAFSVGLPRRETAVLARVGMAASVAVFALFAIGAWGHYLAGIRIDRWYRVGGSLAAFAGLAVACLVGAGVDRRHWRWLGVGAATSAFLISTYVIVNDVQRAPAIFVYVVSVAAVVAHASLMVHVPLRRNQRWLLWGTIAAGIATGFFVDLARLTEPWQEELLGRFAGAAAIVGGCGTLALLVLARINQRAVPSALAAGELREVTLVCPRCGEKQAVAIGTTSCRRCGLMIDVAVREGSP